MNRFFLISLYRSLTRHKLHSALNVGGLAVGIAVFSILLLYVRFETGFEKWLPQHETIYLVQTEAKGADGPFSGKYPNTMGGLLEEMRSDFPGEIGTRVYGSDGGGGGSVIRNGIANTEELAQVDADFFKVFDLPMVRGDKARALSDPSSIVISSSVARKYFGEANPIGQTMTLAFDTPAVYRVSAVFEDLPNATDFRFSILARLPTVVKDEYWHHWGSTTLYTYLRFPTPDAAQAFERKLNDFIDRRALSDIGPNASRVIGLHLLPIARAHLETAGQESGSRKMTVVTLGLVGVLTLLIAIVNYVNLATAGAGLRAREVAMRKVLGADGPSLVRQFLGEAVLTVALASVVGLMISELALPLVNAAGGLLLDIPYLVAVPGLLLLAIVVGIAAGSYPSFLLARIPAADVLASSRSPGGGRASARMREALVVFQFALATAFIVGTFVLNAQSMHLRSIDLGFQRDGLLVIPSLSDPTLDDSKRAALIATFRSIPQVSSVATADTAVGGGGVNNSNELAIPGKPGPGPALRQISAGDGFFDTYRPTLLAGRLFNDSYRMDDATRLKWEEPRNIVINRKAVEKLGLRSPEEAIGKTFGGDAPRTVIGVIDEQRFYSPRLPSDPAYYFHYRGIAPDPVATIRFSGDPRQVADAAQTKWRRIAPQVPFTADTGERLLQKLYEADDRAGRLFGFGAAFAVLIGCIGLWGLASFNTARRVKEIGIRKTLGASSQDIVKLLVGQFLRPVLIATLIAWPLAFLAMRAWLAGYDDRISLSPIYFLSASIIAIAIASLTVIGQSIRASRATPAWALRHD